MTRLFFLLLFVFISSIRGSLTALWMLSSNIGSLLAYILGAYVEYAYIPYICITMPIAFAAIFIMLPNTPRYHLAKGDIIVRSQSNSYFLCEK